jgi:hypothetical protein
MSLQYDEIRITTRREIVICERAIKKLEEVVGAMEDKHRTSSAAFLKDFDPAAHPDHELNHWYESWSALLRWKERLAEHRRIMEM